MTRLAVALACAVALMQNAPLQRFTTSAEAVRVDVLVLEGNRPVAGLAAADFELRDSGVLQQVDVLSRDDVPVSVMLALDTSSSVTGATLERLKDGARAAMDVAGEDERIAVMTFASAVTLASGWSRPDARSRDAVARVTAGGMTALYDAAFAALASTDPIGGRRALILLFSDGTDTASWLPRDAVLEAARRTDAVVYGVVRGDSHPDVSVQFRSGVQLWPHPARVTLESPGFLSELADLTGGRVVRADGAARLRDLFARIIADFRTRYVLTYTPRGVDTAGWHPLEVKVKRRKATVTARRGYSR